MSQAAIEEPTNESWTVGVLARLANCTLRTIRFYEQRGLLHAAKRTQGMHRRYTRQDLERLHAITELRGGGLAIDDIHRALALRSNHSTGEAAAQELDQVLERQLHKLGEQLDQLQRARSEFERLRQALRACKRCRDPDYLSGCVGCDKLRNFATDSVLRVIWKQQ